jgi:hypothetical protein
VQSDQLVLRERPELLELRWRRRTSRANRTAGSNWCKWANRTARPNGTVGPTGAAALPGPMVRRDLPGQLDRLDRRGTRSDWS